MIRDVWTYESSTTFSDVQPNDWFATAAQYVFDKGLMMGTSSTRFSPSATTTRGKIVTILYRMEGSPEISGSCKFSDVAPESWYEKPVVWAAQNGIVNGTSKTTYAPARSITPQEMVTILTAIQHTNAMIRAVLHHWISSPMQIKSVAGPSAR